MEYYSSLKPNPIDDYWDSAKLIEKIGLIAVVLTIVIICIKLSKGGRK